MTSQDSATTRSTASLLLPAASGCDREVLRSSPRAIGPAVAEPIQDFPASAADTGAQSVLRRRPFPAVFGRPEAGPIARGE
jgi:hypothetical protein